MENIITLIYINPLVNDAEHIGIECIKTILDHNNINNEVIYLTDKDEIDSMKINTATATIYAISLTLDNYDLAVYCAKLIKSINKEHIILVGGVLASTAPKQVLTDCLFFDYVAIGDGEKTILQIAKLYMDGITDYSRIRGVYERNSSQITQPETFALTYLPWIDRSLLKVNLYKKNYWARVFSNRKCFGNCAFCCVNYDMTYKNRNGFCEREIEDVVDEMFYINKTYNIQCFLFNDASFEDSKDGPIRKIHKFCSLVAKKNLICSIYANFRTETFRLLSSDTIKIMSETGFVQIFLGVESNNPHELKLYQKRATTYDNQNALTMLSNEDIRIHLGFIMLNSYSTKESLKSNYEFLRNNNRAMIANYTSILIPYYNTKMYYKMLEDGLLLNEYSYKNPNQFTFQDEYVRRAASFITKEVYSSDLLALDDHITNYEKLLLHLNKVFKSQFEDEINDLDILLAQIAQLNSEFWKHLYFDYNLFSAKSNFNTYYQSIKDCYKKMQNNKLNLMKKRKITSFLFE
jgi:radical SAM superfamily enzyme YgiQ (UPF0313 family)